MLALTVAANKWEQNMKNNTMLLENRIDATKGVIEMLEQGILQTLAELGLEYE